MTNCDERGRSWGSRRRELENLCPPLKDEVLSPEAKAAAAMARLALGEGPQGIEERFKSIELLRGVLNPEK